MKLTDRQEKLLSFVKEQHGDQVRKYTGEPYWHHVVAVAEIVSKYAPEGIEIALCHDLFEDTSCDWIKVTEFLLTAGYDIREAYDIHQGVTHLTDFFTPTAYPKMNRAERKSHEAIRLGRIPDLCQSVKYADLINNTESIVKYDPGFAKKYLQEKIQILDKMRNGNINLLIDCCFTLKMAILQLQVSQFDKDVLKNALIELHPLL